MSVSPEQLAKNQSVPTLTAIVEHFTFLIDNIMEQTSDLHYQKEVCYCLRSITNEVKKNMLGQYCSQKYINEKAEKLIWLATNFTVRDDVDIYEQSKSDR